MPVPDAIRFSSMLELVTDGWSSGPVHEATSFWSRWKGIRGVPGGSGLIIRGRSVHGIGLSDPLLVVGLDENDRVVHVARLEPGRVVGCRRAAAMLELQLGVPAPPLGARLRRVPRVI